MIERVRASGIGPVKEADIRFGDLTVFVGPQATGKSIILQLLKLLVDRHAIHKTMRRFGLVQHGYIEKFLNLYFGEGMESIWSDESGLLLGQGKKSTELSAYARPGRIVAPEKMFSRAAGHELARWCDSSFYRFQSWRPIRSP